MVLLLHIAIALTSIIVSSLSWVRPSRSLLKKSYMLVAATLVTGTSLVIANPPHMPSACVSGLVYLAIVGALTTAARFKLATQELTK